MAGLCICLGRDQPKLTTPKIQLKVSRIQIKATTAAPVSPRYVYQIPRLGSSA